MKLFFKNCHLPENLEILFLLILGILLQMADGSPFSLKERWLLVWETELPAQNFSPFVQKVIKIVLSVIVVIRCATTYAYVVSAMLVIFCLLRDTAPKLMLLWLLIAGVKSVCMTFIEALAGVYVCSAFGKIRKACIEFFISKALEIIFAAYLWGSVQNIYQDMERKAESKREHQTKEQIFLQKMDFCRQRARSLVDESTLYKTACLNNFEFKDVPQIILQMLRADNEMSQDSLLGPGMMLASVSNLGSFDHLKTSQSLGELGFMDLGNTQVVGLEEDENLSYREKALRFLKLTKSDVGRIQQNKSCVENDIYTIDRDMWKKVEASGTHINKPKQPRTQVFIRDIQTEPCEENSRIKVRKKSLEYKFGFSFSDLFNDRQSQIDVEQEEEVIFSHDKEEDESLRLIMSNLKEGVIIQPNRLGIVFKKMKGNAYAELYRQEFMSVIGPEVFDRACKLPKMTSLTQLNAVLRHKPSISLSAVPGLKDANLLPDVEEISQTSSEESQRSTDEDASATESSLGDNLKPNFETDSTGEENTAMQSEIINDVNQKFTKSQYTEKFETQDTCSSDSEHSKITNTDSRRSIYVTSSDSCQDIRSRPCFRKRRILIRRTGKTKDKNLFRDSSPFTGNSKNPRSSFEVFEKNDAGIQESSLESTNLSSKTNNLGKMTSNDQTLLGDYSQQMFFLTEFFNKPLLDVLVTYYDLRRRIHVQRQQDRYYKKQSNEFFGMPFQNYYTGKYESIFQSLDFNPDEEKVWKSKVLKTAEAHSKENSIVSFKSVLSIIKRKSVLKRLFRYEYARLMSKHKNYFNSNYEVFLSRIHASDPEWKDPTVDIVENESLHKSNSILKQSSKQDNEISLDTFKGMIERQESNSKNEPEVTVNQFSTEVHSAEKETDVDKLKTEVTQEQVVMSDRKVLEKDPEVESICSQESDEPISLYYSKAANLASPLFDMKRFIYPDHIHYSYKHVKKKGFDVDINGGFPLLMRESLTMGTPVKMGSKLTSKTPEFEITRRPMDLSFASTNAFAEWQNNYQNDLDMVISEKRSQKYSSSGRKTSVLDLRRNKKAKKTKTSRRNSDRNESLSSKIDLNKSKPKNFNIKYLYSAKDYALIEKLLKMHIQLNRNEIETFGSGRKPVQISSTQLHSNKGRINSTYNPAIFLQENKTRCEKKKVETQEERTKDMFARLEREALLHSKNVQKSFVSNRSS